MVGSRVRGKAQLSLIPVGGGLCEKCGKRPRLATTRLGNDWRNTYYLHCRQCRRAGRAKAVRESNGRVWERLLALYGAACACCGESREPFLALDHKEREGQVGRYRTMHKRQIARKILNGKFAASEYRILCHNCNMSRGMRGICPHELERAAEAVLCA